MCYEKRDPKIARACWERDQGGKGGVVANCTTYCLNTCCPFIDCEHHSDNAPRGIPVLMAYKDKTCRRYIGWLVDEAKGASDG